MGFYIGQQGYYEGDLQHQLDIEVSQRPSALYDWNGSNWILNLQKQTIFQRILNDTIDLKDIKQNSTLITVLDMTKLEVDAWFNINFPTLTPTERLRLANVGWLAINAIRLSIRNGG